SPSRRSFVAYRVGNHFALALADPVGPEEEIEGIVSLYAEFCRENDWGVGFHQTLPDFLGVYEKLGFRKIKVGDEAVVDLARFSLDGKDRKAFRHIVNKLEENGVGYQWHEPPLSDEVVEQAKQVSDAWLRIAGRKERRFTLGAFDPVYIRSTPLAAAVDATGKMLAFTNRIPSYRAGEATIDLMRHRPDSPVGVMDYLFVKLFLQLREKGFARFSLGLAPMSGFRENENASVEEKAIHSFFQHLNFLFSYRGLKRYKAKFADSWEPRYSIYRAPLDLARMALALSAVSGMKRAKAGELESPEEEDDILGEATAEHL
ncbi:MAG: phosphatidylglycerol lysyltransferase domain-containing protein, partial [Candidatus Krumholzibacteria bacterium]|nr:phosphatidylglycerol lysyltransferase domain-containing protein [Candidatus Krumholzibacteria bacterium]